jgi:hypothetical protein
VILTNEDRISSLLSRVRLPLALSLAIIGSIIVNTMAWLPNREAWTWRVPNYLVWAKPIVRGVKHVLM